MEETIMVFIILGTFIFINYLFPYLKTFLDKQKRESMENICETKYHMNKYKYKYNKIDSPYSYSDMDNTTPSIVSPKLPLSIPSVSPTLQTLSSVANTYINKDNEDSLFNIAGKQYRTTGFFTDTSFRA